MPIDFQLVIDPDRAFHSLRAAILKAGFPKPLSLLRGTANRPDRDSGAQCSNISSPLEKINTLFILIND